MTFEFIFGDIWYQYNDGAIHYKDKYGVYVYLCPVLDEFNKKLEDFSTEQLQIILSAIIHSYGCGKCDGKNAKIREFKNLFNLY